MTFRFRDAIGATRARRGGWLLDFNLLILLLSLFRRGRWEHYFSRRHMRYFCAARYFTARRRAFKWSQRTAHFIFAFRNDRIPRLSRQAKFRFIRCWLFMLSILSLTLPGSQEAYFRAEDCLLDEGMRYAASF